MSTLEVLSPSAVLNIPEPPAKEPFQKDSNAMVMRAENFAIATNQEYIDAAEILKDIARKKSKIEEAFKPSVKAAFAAHRSLTQLVSTLTDPLIKADKLFRSKMVAYTDELKRQSEETEREEREAAEAIAREDQQRESDRLAAEAAEMEKSGDTLGAEATFAEAQNVASAPLYVPPIAVTSTIPKVQGVSTRGDWTIDDDVDVMALCKAVVDGKAPLMAILPNMAYLRQRAKSDKGMFAIPGVRAYDKGGMTVRKS